MLNKRFTSAIQSACLVQLILAMACSTSGSPVNKSEESSSTKVVDFSVHVNESGEEYNETIEVDTEKQTELFRVPAHPGVDRSDVLNDFKQKLTMLRIAANKACYLMPMPKEQSTPEKLLLFIYFVYCLEQKLTMLRIAANKACYLMPMPKEQSTPEKLLRDLKKAEQEVITESRRIDSTWIIKGELNERSFLSNELKQFCTGYQIYLVKKAQDSLAVTTIQAKAKRKRRGINDLCPGGMTQNEAFENCDGYPKLRCKVLNKTCYKFVVCETNDITVQRRPSGANLRVMSAPDKCQQKHIYRNIVCCQYICP